MAFRALANPWRRYVLCILFEADLSEGDALRPGRLYESRRAPDVSRDARLSLRHNHLPWLADRGFVEWDEETGRLSPGQNWEQVAVLLRLLYENREALPDAWVPERRSLAD